MSGRAPKPVAGQVMWPRGYVTGLLAERDSARTRAQQAEAEVVRLRGVLLVVEHAKDSHRGASDREVDPCPKCRGELESDAELRDIVGMLARDVSTHSCKFGHRFDDTGSPCLFCQHVARAESALANKEER